MAGGVQRSGFRRPSRSIRITPVTTTPRSETLESRLQAVHAAGRVDESLLAVALDALEPFASDYLSGDDYRRLCQVLREPVQLAREAALATLVDSLVRQSADGDLDLAAHREAIRRRSL